MASDVELLVVDPVYVQISPAAQATAAITQTVGAPTVLIVPDQGAAGPPGPAGPAFDGTAWWYGQGPPGAVVGSKAGDFYLNTDNGTVYELH